jgi:dsDNA-specific endonuclease/ATPase MutS2
MARRRDRGDAGDRSAWPGPPPDELDADLFTEPLDAVPQVGEPAGDAPIGDALDLHTFRPAECADVVAEYLIAARAAGLARVRLIHGKGSGTLRRIVHGVLDRHPAVRGYRLGDERSGSWGATVVELAPTDP